MEAELVRFDRHPYPPSFWVARRQLVPGEVRNPQMQRDRLIAREHVLRSCELDRGGLAEHPLNACLSRGERIREAEPRLEKSDRAERELVAAGEIVGRPGLSDRAALVGLSHRFWQVAILTGPPLGRRSVRIGARLPLGVCRLFR